MGFFSAIENTIPLPPQTGTGHCLFRDPECNRKSETRSGSTYFTCVKEKESRVGVTNRRLLSGDNNDPEAEHLAKAETGPPDMSTTLETIQPNRTARKLKGENLENFQAAWPWLNANLDTLLAVGWTRAELFQRGKYRFPLGRWGIAWLDTWRRDGVLINLGNRGQVIFTYSNRNRKIVQSSHSVVTRKNIDKTVSYKHSM